MPDSVSGNNRPGAIDHSPPPPSPSHAPTQAPSAEEAARFNAIIADPDQDTGSGGGGQEEGESTETGSGNTVQQYGQGWAAQGQGPVVQSNNQVVSNYFQGSPNLQNSGSSSDHIDNDRQNNDDGPANPPGSSVQQNNQDNSQSVHGQSGQQNHQGGSSGNDSHDEKTKAATEKYGAEMGLSILSSMGAIEEAVPEAGSSESRQTIVNLGQELLDKFYTSDSGDKSVYLELKVLDGAKVLLTKEAGALSIQFDATTDSSASLLNNLKPGLVDYMEKRLGQTVEVKVKNLGGGDQAGGDGRSKQQRSVIDEYRPGSAS